MGNVFPKCTFNPGRLFGVDAVILRPHRSVISGFGVFLRTHFLKTKK